LEVPLPWSKYLIQFVRRKPQVLCRMAHQSEAPHLPLHPQLHHLKHQGSIPHIQEMIREIVVLHLFVVEVEVRAVAIGIAEKVGNK
jgi:hypothetical protein